MIFYQKIGGESYFIDSVTHNSFMLFIILREYICSLMMSDNSEDQIQYSNSKDTISLYMLMYEMLKENIGNPFDILKCNSQSARIPAYLKPLVRGRIERLRNYYEAVAYTNLSTFKNLIFAKSLNVGNEIDDDDDEDSGDGGGDVSQNSNRRRFLLTKDSVFGLFIRKFSLGIYSQSFEKIIQFLDSFFDAYDNEMCSISNLDTEDLIVQKFAHSFARDQYLISTRNQALDVCSEIIDSIGKIGGRPNLNLQKYNELLLLAKKMYPEVSYTHYASHVYALHKRNLTMAENELHAYFETCMASVQNPEISLTTSTFSGAGTVSTTTTTTVGQGTITSSVLTPPINSSNTCAHMAVTGAAMHLNFGHWYKGKCLIKEALQKSLESESKDSLGHVKVTHTLLNSSTDPFRYDNEVPMKQSFKLNVSYWIIFNELFYIHLQMYHYVENLVKQDVTLTEFRTQFWNKLDIGSEPYKNMATVLMQCIINADCLEPCPYSDTVLANAFANIIKEFNSMGSIETALKLSKICRSTLCRFLNQSPLLQASMEVELEQHLRSGYDLAQCDRLVNSIKLYCPWESAIRQAEVEQKRGNVSYTHDILRYIIDSVIARRDHDCGLLQQSANNNKLLHSNELWSQTKPFSHIILPTFPEHTPVGGLCKLALIELRAHLALIELLITLKLYVYAFNEIDITLKLCKHYRLSLGIEMIKLLQCAIHLSMNNNNMMMNTNPTNDFNDNKNTKIDHIDIDPTSLWINGLKQTNSNVIFELNNSLEEILHRTDQLTKYRCQVFLSRTRLLIDINENNHSFIQMHMSELLKALNYYRQLDDRKRILDILVLMAAALNSVNEYVKRNEVSKSFHILREHFGFKSLPSKRFIVDIL
uniref:Anaphase-promoting complex subunit 5 n=1 Tax=Schistosoma haematobium TaxID=6185 RepID=A0A095C7N0_SCHHA